MNSSYHEGKFLRLKVLKAKSLPDQNQPEKCKPDLSPVSCTIEKVGNEQHILHLLSRSYSQASNSFHQNAYI